MSKYVYLDTNTLGDVAHPDKRFGPVAIWANSLAGCGIRIAISEIADYELRRELVLNRSTRSISRLDELKTDYIYVPITTAAMLRASDLWATARRRGRPFASNKALDGDAILAAQVQLAIEEGHEVVVATDNVKHLSLFVDARQWQDIPVQ